MFQSRVVVVGARMIWRAEEAKIFSLQNHLLRLSINYENVFRYFTIHTKKNLQSSDISKKKRNQRRNSPVGLVETERERASNGF